MQGNHGHAQFFAVPNATRSFDKTFASIGQFYAAGEMTVSGGVDSTIDGGFEFCQQTFEPLVIEISSRHGS